MPINKEILEKKFREEYEKLNEKQQLAVNTIEGPVMVIAGPGTGKTQILATRIGKILLDTDVYPGNILCLTFTDSGAVVMRKRLLQLIGPDAYKVNIYTFHAFCNEIIQENLSYFEKTSMDPVSELEKIRFLKELIDTFPKNNPLKRYRGDVYFEINNLEILFSTMKKERWSPQYVTECIDEYLADLPNRIDYIYKISKDGKWKKGDFKPNYYEEVDRMVKLRAAVGEYDRFQQMMRNKNRYDFDDMINWVIDAFSDNKNLLANYQERFQYILVDEYQDTNGTQNRLVELLISYWDKPNVFVVGDDDQSIFRFQGANVENMLAFANTYQNDLLTVVLENNYRSTQPILDISKSVIERNDERLVKKLPGLTKELLSSRDGIRELKHLPLIKEYETQRQEMIGITREVQQLVIKGVSPGRIGIIYRENKYGDELSQYLKWSHIPVYIKKNLNLLEQPLSQKILLWLRFLAAEHDLSFSGDEMLFEILHVDWWKIPPIEIAKLSMEVADKKSAGEKTSLRQLLAEKSNTIDKDLFTPSLPESLKAASSIIEELIADVSNCTLQQLFENFIRKSGALAHIMQSQEKHWQLQILSGLFDFIKEETHRNPLINLQALVNLFDLMENEDIPLPLVQVSGSDRGVNLLTVHGSKGLEFEYVFLAGCNAYIWESKKVPRRGYKLPDNLFSATARSATNGNNNETRNYIQHEPEALQELRRSFYVALTRAEQHLSISYCQFKNDGKDAEPSVFIAEIQEKHQLPVEKVILDTELVSEFAALNYGEPEAPEIEKMEEEFISRLLEKFVLNVTALNNYLQCPLEFYYRNLIRIPAPKNENTEFGSAVHYSLERLFRKMQDSGTETFPSKEEFIGDFEWYMKRHRESFTREQFERRKEYGYEILDNYYDKHIRSFNKIVAVERNFRNVIVKGVPLKGKLDKLEFDGNLVNVVDYKTGDPDKGIQKSCRPSEKEPNGGNYWRQAVFYKILVDNYEQKAWKVTSSEFDFIEPDKKKNYRKQKLLITPEDITTVTQQIVQTWQKIQAREFYIGCGKNDCHWCNFVKTNKLAIALHELESAEESEA